METSNNGDSSNLKRTLCSVFFFTEIVKNYGKSNNETDLFSPLVMVREMLKRKKSCPLMVMMKELAVEKEARKINLS